VHNGETAASLWWVGDAECSSGGGGGSSDGGGSGGWALANDVQQRWVWKQAIGWPGPATAECLIGRGVEWVGGVRKWAIEAI
jgi:hypothetical protein